MLTKTKTLKKLDLTQFDFKELAQMTDLEFLNWTREHRLDQHQSWFLPQLIAQLGSWQPQFSDSGLPLVKQTLAKAYEADPNKAKVLWRFTRLQRKELISKQVDCPQYAKLTPLILLAQRQHWNVKYQAWRQDKDIRLILEPDLAEGVLMSVPQLEHLRSLGSAELLEIRHLGLLAKTGAAVGQLKNPMTTWNLTSIGTTELGAYPKLTQSILTQIWIAHPSNRHHNMILDLWNWDTMPEPLVVGEIFNKPKSATKSKPAPKVDECDLPWN